jgi:ABC-type cobalamin/Fe3+-siderophores transport system ATPase subunit
MKLHSLFIEKYKLFENFSVDFQDSKHFCVFIGKNGSGKTTLIEAFTHIFSKLFTCKDFSDIKKVDFPFNFQITYLLRREKIEQTSMFGYSYTNYIGVEISFNNKPKITLYEADKKIEGTDDVEKHLRNKGEELKYILPDNFVVYYSGISNSIYEIFNRFQNEVITGSLTGEIKFDQPFYYFLPTNLPSVLIGLFSYEYGNIPELLANRFRITGFESIKLIFTKPSWAKARSKAENFWGAMGELSQFMSVLAGNAKTEYNADNIVITIEDKSQLDAVWSIYGTEKRLFEYLVSLQANDFLTTIDLTLYKSGQAISYQNLSEGEKQLIIISGLKELLAAENSLFLLDEPDTYLHPSWKREFVSDIFKEHQDLFRNYSVITTHSPNILSALKKGQLYILINESGKSRLKEVSFNTFGKPVDELLIDFFDVESLRFQGVQEKLDQIWGLIKSGQSKSEEFGKLFNELEQELGKDDKALTEIKIELIKREKANAKN